MDIRGFSLRSREVREDPFEQPMRCVLAYRANVAIKSGDARDCKVISNRPQGRFPKSTNDRTDSVSITFLSDSDNRLTTKVAWRALQKGAATAPHPFLHGLVDRCRIKKTVLPPLGKGNQVM